MERILRERIVPYLEHYKTFADLSDVPPHFLEIWKEYSLIIQIIEDTETGRSCVQFNPVKTETLHSEIVD